MVFEPGRNVSSQDYVDGLMYAREARIIHDDRDDQTLFRLACQAADRLSDDTGESLTERADQLYAAWSAHRTERLLHGSLIYGHWLYMEHLQVCDQEFDCLLELLPLQRAEVPELEDAPLLVRPFEEEPLVDEETEDLHRLLLKLPSRDIEEALAEHAAAEDADDEDDNEEEADDEEEEEGAEDDEVDELIKHGCFEEDSEEKAEEELRRQGESSSEPIDSWKRDLVHVANAPQCTRAVATRALATLVGHIDIFYTALAAEPEAMESRLPVDYEEPWAYHLANEIITRLLLGLYPDDGDPFEWWEGEARSRPAEMTAEQEEEEADLQMAIGNVLNGRAEMTEELERRIENRPAPALDEDGLYDLYQSICGDPESDEAAQARARYYRAIPVYHRAAEALLAGKVPTDEDREAFVDMLDRKSILQHKHWLRPGLISTRFPMSVTWADLGFDDDEAGD